MKMTKRFEKKLKAFAKRNNLDTNFNWDIGWFDFLYGNIKIGAVRFVGNEDVFIELYSSCNLKSWEEFEMYMKRYKVFERAALKFKKELIIESKKLELENDFNADDD